MGFTTTYGQMFNGVEKSNTNKKLMEVVNRELGNKPKKKKAEK